MYVFQSVLTKKTAKRDALTTVMSVNFVRHSSSFPAILSASLNFKAHWLVTHLHVSHISAVFISPPSTAMPPSSAAIIQHRILLCVEDSNRKLRAYFYGMVPVQDIVVYTYQLSYYLYNKDITNSV